MKEKKTLSLGVRIDSPSSNNVNPIKTGGLRRYTSQKPSKYKQSENENINKYQLIFKRHKSKQALRKIEIIEFPCQRQHLIRLRIPNVIFLRNEYG